MRNNRLVVSLYRALFHRLKIDRTIKYNGDIYFSTPINLIDPIFACLFFYTRDILLHAHNLKG